MSRLENVWVIAESVSGMAELTAGAAALGENTALVYAGDPSAGKGARTLYHLGGLENTSFLNYIAAIVALVKEKRPNLVLIESTKNGKMTAAALAAALDTCAVTDAAEVTAQAGCVLCRRLVYGGLAYQSIEVMQPVAIVCMCVGAFEPATVPVEGDVVEVAATPERVRFIERRPKVKSNINLGAAKYIVGVGRGFGNQENLRLARGLADVIGGEVGCSRPVAEEEHWMPAEAYLGVSGVVVKSDLYIACGISGQVQHLVGVNQVKTIVAVNKDKNAPIFKNCDFGIVGDLNAVLPALAARFKQ